MRLLSRYGVDRPVDRNSGGVPHGMMSGIDRNPANLRLAPETAGCALPGPGVVSSAIRNSREERRMALGSSLLMACLVAITAITLLMPVPSSAAGRHIKATAMTFCPDDDGSAGAPSGTIQQPNLLNGYVATINMTAAPGLNCKVAGVDYAVGIPAGTTLTPWSSVSQAGVTVHTGSLNYLEVSGNNVTLNAIDFSTGGCAFVSIDSSVTGTTIIKNSNFACPTTFVLSYMVADVSGTHNLSIINCKFNGENVGSNENAFISFVSAGTMTLQYNWFLHSQQQVLNLSAGLASINQTLDYRFNYLEDIAACSTCALGLHMNYQQLAYGKLTITNEHNTTYQHSVRSDLAAGEGFQFYNGAASSNGTNTLVNPTMRYNTMIALLSGGHQTMSNMVHGVCHSTSDCSSTLSVISGTCNIDHNFGDATGAFNFFYPSGGAAMWTACTLANNTNMVTGAAFTNTP